MFRSVNRRSLSTLASKLARSRIGLAAGSLALLAGAAPLMGAGPWDWHRGHRDREVVIRTEVRPRVVVTTPVVTHIEVDPLTVQVNAYQSGDTVMIFATGTNRNGGYTTSLRAINSCGPTTSIQLCNLAPVGVACTESISSFTLNAAMHADCIVRTVDVRLANRVICVPVQQVARIS